VVLGSVKKGADRMNKRILVLCVAALLIVLATCTYAFSFSLSSLHVNAASFAHPALAPAAAAPMTYDAESNISQPQGDTVRFEQVQPTVHLCHRDKTTDSQVGF
jgi:flagellar basal body-associated protein FliL